jgi:hypothetical protein
MDSMAMFGVVDGVLTAPYSVVDGALKSAPYLVVEFGCRIMAEGDRILGITRNVLMSLRRMVLNGVKNGVMIGGVIMAEDTMAVEYTRLVLCMKVVQWL